MKKFGLIVLGIILFQAVSSQVNYMPGFIIDNTSDTLHGFIDYRNWKNNPNQINFKIQIEDNPLIYKPHDIKEFRVANTIYVSAIIDIKIDPVQSSKLDNQSQLKTKVDTVFLKTLFKGTRSLYYYIGNEGIENFYIKQNTLFELLRYKQYYEIQDGKRVVKENNQYLGQLNLYLGDCNMIQTKLERVSYNQTSLLGLFVYYHECTLSDVYFSQEIEKIRVETGLITGVTSTSLQFISNSYQYQYLVNAGFNSSINVTTGLFLNLVLPYNQRKWSINNEILYSTYSVKGLYEQFENENQYSITNTELGYSFLKINTLIQYKYPIGGMFLFLNGGISNGFVLNEKNYKHSKIKFYTTERIVEEPALEDARRHEQGIVIGMGANYKNFIFEVRHERGNGMSKILELHSSTKSYCFLVGYKFL
jgi:hypothetical protein